MKYHSFSYFTLVKKRPLKMQNQGLYLKNDCPKAIDTCGSKVAHLFLLGKKSHLGSLSVVE